MDNESSVLERAFHLLEDRRVSVISAMDRKHRAAFGQFFTPGSVARYMASLLQFPNQGEAHLLDAGAGIGSLTAAAARAARKTGSCRIKATCYEVEPQFQAELKATLADLPNVSPRTEQRDFVEHAITLATSGRNPGYSHAILNPPYKKINAGSRHRRLMRELSIETSNLYTCFVASAIALCRKDAQVVVIIPRSFMNGPYFKSFRYWLLDRVAITHIHVFERRDLAFADDGVLQENVIIRMVVGAQQGDVAVTACDDPSFADIHHRRCRFEEIVTRGDAEKFIHVPAPGSTASGGLPGVALRELGLDVCTGPVVDFRLRDHLRKEPEQGTVPLLYASHFSRGGFEWPRAGRKPNAILRNSATERWLMPTGNYVILRRFTSKEERRRVVAYPLKRDALPGDAVGFENHLNVIHHNHHGLSPGVAAGLVKYLNSKVVDDYFRVFSGHTQVNATDLRRLRYPTYEELERMGRDALAPPVTADGLSAASPSSPPHQTATRSAPPLFPPPCSSPPTTTSDHHYCAHTETSSSA